MRRSFGAFAALCFAAAVAACSASQVQSAASYWAAAKVGIDAYKADQSATVVARVGEGEAVVDQVLTDLDNGTSTKANLQVALDTVKAVVAALPAGTLNTGEQAAVTALEAELAYQIAKAS